MRPCVRPSPSSGKLKTYAFVSPGMESDTSVIMDMFCLQFLLLLNLCCVCCNQVLATLRDAAKMLQSTSDTRQGEANRRHWMDWRAMIGCLPALVWFEIRLGTCRARVLPMIDLSALNY